MKKFNIFILIFINLFNQINSKECKTIEFNFDGEEITRIINKVSAIKNINVLYPQNEKLSIKLNYSTPNEITIDEAWQIIERALDISGYSIVAKKDVHQIVNNSGVLKEPLQIYFNVNIDKIPNTNQRIRYLYYFENISIASGSTITANLDQILKDMLTAEPDGNYLLDSATNSLLITHRASDIKGVMKIISELDKTGIRETIEVIPLLHTGSDYITKIITNLIATPDNQSYGFFPKQQKAGIYFSENTKVIAIDRINAVAILGPNDSVKRVKNFIVKHLDKPIESSKSVIHVRPLEYIDANDIAPVLQNIIKAKAAGAQAESKSDELANAIVIAEQQVTTEGLKPTTSGEPGATTGGDTSSESQNAFVTGSNSLIVAAKRQDWQEIKRIIDQLDVPAPQVAIEVLIVQLDLQRNKDLGSQLRNINNTGIPKNFNFQIGQLESPFLNYATPGDPNSGFNTQKGLAADLLQPSQLGIVSPGETEGTVLVDPNLNQPGTFWLSFADKNGIAYVYHQLNNAVYNKIVSNPFIIVKNNIQATITNELLQFFSGPVSVASAAGIVTKFNATSEGLVIDVKPRISDIETVNLELSVKINAFQELIQNTIVKREFRSNVNLKNKEVIAFGGMLTDDDAQTESKFPILEKIPLIGWMFKRRISSKEKRVLYTFISPTIIHPRVGGGMSDFSKDKMNMMKDNLHEAEESLLGKNFEKLKDPITKFFLPTEYNNFVNTLDNFSAENKHENKPVASPLDPALSKTLADKNVVPLLNEQKQTEIGKVNSRNESRIK